MYTGYVEGQDEAHTIPDALGRRFNLRAAASLSVSAANLPTYRVNAGEAQVGLSGIQFTFTGANLSIAGSEDFPPGPCGGLLGFPCGQAGDSIDINTLLVGSMFGFGTALATSFPFLEFVGDVDLVGAPLVIPNTKNPIVRGAFTFNNAPYLTACVPPFQCFEGGARMLYSTSSLYLRE